MFYVSDIPQPEEQIPRSIFLIEQVCVTPTEVPGNSYFVSECDFGPAEEVQYVEAVSILLNDNFERNYDQTKLISFANEVFADSKPLPDFATKVINNLLVNSISKTPTKL